MPGINYTLNIDTSRVATAMSEVRSQMNTAIGGGGAGLGGFVDTGRAAFGGISDFGGAAAAGGAAIVSGLRSIPQFGGSATPESMSMVPHYGILNAQASLQAEWMSRVYGPAGAVPFAPPGVSGLEYHNYLMREHTRKFAEAGTDAAIAGGTAIAGFAAGMGGWEIGSKIGAAVGTVGGPPGRVVGWLAGGLIGSALGEKGVEFVAGHATRERAATKEMGEIIDAGRQLPLDLRRELGRAAITGARQVGVSEDDMANILAGASRLGTMPPTTDPKAMTAQAADLARSITDIAHTLHTSLWNAQQMMKSLERYGFHGVEGADWLVGQAGRIGGGISPAGVYGLAMGGAEMGRRAQIGGTFGFHFMPEEAYRATHAGLNREQLQMAGGVTGLANVLAGEALGNAFGPMGMLQMAAAPGVGFPLPGSVEETITGGIRGLQGRGGQDFMRNVVAMQTRRGQIVRAMGPNRTIEMADAELRNRANMVAGITGVDPEEMARYFAMQGGANENQAAAMAFRAVNPAAHMTGDAVVGGLVSKIREEREREHAFRARREDMQYPFPGGGVFRAGRDFGRWLGGATSIREGASEEATNRARATAAGLPYDDVSSETVQAVRDDVAHGRVGAGLAMPTHPEAARHIDAMLGLTGGRPAKSGLDAIRRSQNFSSAWGTPGSTVLSARTQKAIARVWERDPTMRAKFTDFESRIAAGDRAGIQSAALKIAKGTPLESIVRKEGVVGVVEVYKRGASYYEVKDELAGGEISETLVRSAASAREGAKVTQAQKHPLLAALEGLGPAAKKGGALGGEVGRVDLASEGDGSPTTAFLARMTRHLDTMTNEIVRLHHTQGKQ